MTHDNVALHNQWTSVKQASCDWVLFDLDETLLDFPVARRWSDPADLRRGADSPPRWRSTMPSTSGSGSSTTQEIDATHLQQTRFSLFAEQVNVAPMAMNETFPQQIIALRRAAGGWRRPCRP